MGWKTIKEHFGIKHFVHVAFGVVYIGSEYLPNLIQIHPDGSVVQDSLTGNDSPWSHYLTALREAEASGELRKLYEAEDQFSVSLPIFTYEDANIIELKCEAYGWPNLTHDGRPQYRNYFSADRNQVIAWAKEMAKIRKERADEDFDSARKELDKAARECLRCASIVGQLEREFPDIPAAI